MSELNKKHIEENLRRYLLVSASTAALLVSYCGIDALAAEEESERPQLWIELGGNLEGMSGSQEPFLPSFTSTYAPNGILSPERVEGAPHYSFGLEGELTFEPKDSDWTLSVGVKYGRSSTSKKQHQQFQNKKFPVHYTFPAYPQYGIASKYKYVGWRYPTIHSKFADAMARQSQQHLVVDFQAGKDVGLGLFGHSGSSVISAGVRVAQFVSKTSVSLRAEPDLQYPDAPITTWQEHLKDLKYPTPIHFHDYGAMASVQRSFTGVGPSVSWDASAPLLGTLDEGQVTFDWGANAAVLIGRQKVREHNQTTVRTYYKKGWYNNNGANPGPPLINYGGFTTQSITQRNNSANNIRTRTVAVPNLGGFAGMSFRYQDAKISVGYRADFFLGAMDGGIAERKSETLGFYGPFATISIGLGG